MGAEGGARQSQYSLHCLTGVREPYGVKGGMGWGKSRVLVREYHQVWKLVYMLDQVGTITCPRTQRRAGGRGRMLIYVRRNTNYNQTISKGVTRSNLHSGRVQLAHSGHVTEQSVLPRTLSISFSYGTLWVLPIVFLVSKS